MSILVDTNVLLRSAQLSHPLRSIASGAITFFLRQRETVCVCPQNIAEFWNVATARVYEIDRILTFNGADFKRYKDISIIDPALVS
jgi:predicted nucleic acid-binding protein